MAFPYFCPEHGYRSEKCCEKSARKAGIVKNAPDGKRFTWGDIVDIHEIGPYCIVEAIWRTNGIEDGKPGFFVYVNSDGLGFKDVGLCSPSLDGALLLAVARRAEGTNTMAAHYMAKMLGIQTEYA